MEKKRLFVLIAAIIVLVIFAYFFFPSYENCKERVCFEKAILSCKKAIYVNDLPDSVWQYKIQGAAKEGCEIDVRLIQLKEGKAENQKLENKEMVCYLPRGFLDYPQNDLTKCSGKLKENMQELMIERMQKYILDNFGKISSEFVNPSSKLVIPQVIPNTTLNITNQTSNITS